MLSSAAATITEFVVVVSFSAAAAAALGCGGGSRTLIIPLYISCWAGGLVGTLLFVLFFFCFFPSCELLLPFFPVQQWTHPFRTFFMPCVLCGGQKAFKQCPFCLLFCVFESFFGF